MSRPIVFSRTQYTTTDECWRRRWLAYEAPNGSESSTLCSICHDYFSDPAIDGKRSCPRCGIVPIVNGWQRRSHAIPLITGSYVHKGLEAILTGATPYDAAIASSDEYRMVGYERGLDCAGDMSAVIEEQSTLVAGLVYAWGLARWPIIRDEWEVLHVEREGAAKIAEDATLQYRADWIGRRRTDGQVFVWNFKTLSLLDERWLRGWDIDAQVLTEAWAVASELGVEVAGVIIEGLIKGTRRKDKDEFGQTIGERQQSPLCYGYHAAGNPPLTPPEWTHEYKRGKGWQRFAVGTPGHPTFNEWIDALPAEVVEGLFVTVPPVYRNDARVLSKLTQMVSREREIAAKADAVRAGTMDVDAAFPQHERACLWPSRCPFFDACHTPGVAEDMAGSGLYIAREPNHPVMMGDGE